MFKLSRIVTKCVKNGNMTTNFMRISKFSSPAIVETKLAHDKNFETNGQTEDKTESIVSKEETSRIVSRPSKPTRSIVAAAFASLNDESVDNTNIKTPFTDDKIAKASSVNELLNLSDGNGVSRRHALKVVSILAEWISDSKISLADFEADPRFIRLCKVLTKGPKNYVQSKSEDLTTILSVTADDEAARLVATITLPQMVKVMSTLSMKKRRSTLLLRSLSYNITKCSDRLNLKQSADLLYTMSTLNFYDDNLLSKICNDICTELGTPLNKSAAIGSIVTSFGFLRYKNPEVLDAISEWIVKQHKICRPQDVFGFLMTLGVVNYLPANQENLFQTILPELSLSEAGKAQTWLEVVWSLVLLNKADKDHVSSVLSDSFVNSLKEHNSLSMSTKLKLLNISGYAKYLLKEYKGPILTEKNLDGVEFGRSKEKTEMVSAMTDSLKNLIQSEKYLKTNVDSGYGFYIDAFCRMDKNCAPLSTGANEEKDSKKVAMLCLDYHDMSRGKIGPTGVNVLAKQILEAQNYNVLTIPYTDFTPSEKLINRVQLLESKLKDIVKN